MNSPSEVARIYKILKNAKDNQKQAIKCSVCRKMCNPRKCEHCGNAPMV